MEVRSVESVVKALNGANVQYLIVGGLAVIAHGYERFTNDVDLVIGLDRDNISRGLRAVMALGYQMRIPVTPEQFAEPALREAWRCRSLLGGRRLAGGCGGVLVVCRSGRLRLCYSRKGHHRQSHGSRQQQRSGCECSYLQGRSPFKSTFKIGVSVVIIAG